MDNDLTHRAERAALGAMIRNQQLAGQLDCLEARDFTEPRHRTVFVAVRMLSGERPLTPGKWRSLIVSTARPVTAGYLAGLAAACPDPAHGPAYAAMLIQASLYRVARQRADDIDAQAALLGYEGTRLAEAGGTGGKQVAGLGAHLADVARAIRGHTSVLAPGSADPSTGTQATSTDLRAGLARATSHSARPAPGTPHGAVPPPTAADIAARREELVLSALLRQHAQARQILDFLPASAFTSPARQQVYRAIHRVSMSGHPVDELTVTWDLATRPATTAVVSPGTALPPLVPDGYVDRLARAAVSGDRSPLRVAHDLTARLDHRSTADRPSAPSRRPDAPVPAQAPQAPPGPAQTRGPGLEQGR